MKLFGKCETHDCGRWAFFVRKRRYQTAFAGEIVGKAQTCGRCYRKIKGMVQ